MHLRIPPYHRFVGMYKLLHGPSLLALFNTGHTVIYHTSYHTIPYHTIWSCVSPGDWPRPARDQDGPRSHRAPASRNVRALFLPLLYNASRTIRPPFAVVGLSSDKVPPPSVNLSFCSLSPMPVSRFSCCFSSHYPRHKDCSHPISPFS